MHVHTNYDFTSFRANGCHLLQLTSKNAGLDISSKNNNLGLDNLLEVIS